MDVTANFSLSGFYFCSDSYVFIFIYGFLTARTALILPFGILVLYQFHQRRCKQRSVRPLNLSELITQHMAVLQLIGLPGLAAYACGFYLPGFTVLGVYIFSVVTVGELLFHVVTCVERYLAVVHPVKYVELKTSKASWLRHACVGSVWCVSCGWILVIAFYSPKVSTIPFFCISTLSFVLVSFCSLSILCALSRPAPGQEVGKKEITQSKQKVFQTVVLITAALSILFMGYLVCISLDALLELSYSQRCWLVASTVWFSLPSTLLVPLLFLHKAGKLPCF